MIAKVSVITNITTAYAEAGPNLNELMPTRKISNATFAVDQAGPPDVMRKISLKIRKDDIVAIIATYAVAGRTRGNVMLMNWREIYKKTASMLYL